MPPFIFDEFILPYNRSKINTHFINLYFFLFKNYAVVSSLFIKRLNVNQIIIIGISHLQDIISIA